MSIKSFKKLITKCEVCKESIKSLSGVHKGCLRTYKRISSSHKLYTTNRYGLLPKKGS
jgi:hypothetical protein